MPRRRERSRRGAGRIGCLVLGGLLAGCATDSGEALHEALFEPFADGEMAGNPSGGCLVPAVALPDTLAATTVVGDGTREGCTGAAFRTALARGGRIAFDCGGDTVTILLDSTAVVRNDGLPDVVVDGGGKVALSGGGTRRILYQNTCDPSLAWTTSHCQDQDHPRLTLQNLTLVDGDSESDSLHPGGGAVWVRGGSLRIVNCRFRRNVCVRSGPDEGGGAVRATDQSGSGPVRILATTFEDNTGSNGGALSGLGTSWSIWNSRLAGNRAVGSGGNPAAAGTPGGGSGGAIYADGNTMTLSLCGSVLEGDSAATYGAAIFFVTNDRTGTLRISDSRISGNLGGGWHVLPGIAMHEDTRRSIVRSVIED